jgi:PadR family transcriptional regulator, regulatory protein PadR
MSALCIIRALQGHQPLRNLLDIYRVTAMRLRAQSPQTHLVLRTLFEAPEQWHYGYDLSRTTGLKPGTLYPILARLTERGLLTSQWEPEAPEGRPRRHLYRLSEAGVVHVARSATPGVRVERRGRRTQPATGES